jgi:8-oxo-dGTP pyrophosphatase MutT (NUDIX family)
MHNISAHDSETPARGQQVITACAFIHHSFEGVEKVFLPKRANTKKFLPGVYELPGGHIDYGEDIISGLKREILEEFEMNASIGDPFYVFTYSNDIKGSHSIEVVFFAVFTDSLDTVKIHPDDHSRYGWFGEDELGQAVTDTKTSDDPEFQAIKKGFSLLKGGSPRFT